MGVLVAVATAAAVFGVGMVVLPSVEPPPPEHVVLPPPPPAPEPAPPPAPAPAPEPAAAQAPVPPEPQPTTAPVEPKPASVERKRVAATAEPKPAEPKPAKAKPAAEPGAPAKPEAAAHDRPGDKDLARDAWRKNLPDVSAEPGKATMLIPIKGSTEGATYHVTAKPRTVLIALPKGESMITMPFYSVKRDGFRQLWIKKDDETGTSIRVVLGDGSDPQVDIKDEFVRVTVRRPAASTPDGGALPPGAAPQPAAPAEAPAKPAGD